MVKIILSKTFVSIFMALSFLKKYCEVILKRNIFFIGIFFEWLLSL